MRAMVVAASSGPRGEPSASAGSPLTAKQPHHERVGDLALDDPALAEQALPHEAESFDRPGGRLVARIELGLEAVEPEFAEPPVDDRGEGLVVVPAAPLAPVEDVPELGPAALIVDR